MAEENKLNQTPEITPAPAAEAPEKAPTTGELLGDVEHYDEEKDDWSTGYYGTGSRQQVTDDVFHKLETGEELTRDDFIKAELALQDAKLEAGIDLEKEKSPGPPAWAAPSPQNNYPSALRRKAQNQRCTLSAV